MKSLWTDIKNLLIETFFGKDRWSELEKQAEESGDSIPTIMWEGFVQSISKLYDKVKTKIQEKVIQPIKDKYEDMKQAGGDLINGLASGIEEKWEDITTKAKETWEKIKSPFKWAWQNAFGWGYDIVSGIVEGIKKGWEWLKEGVNNVWDKIKDSIKDKLNIHSPSGVFEGFGQDIMLGLEKGINDFSSKAVESLNDVAKQMADVDLSAKSDIGLISGGIGTNMSAQASQLTSIKDEQLQQQAGAQTTINRNFYVQPGQMIATRGEVRNFVRMLREYDKFEEER